MADIDVPADARVLDPDQAVAASALRGPVCILAGPGTGKTRTVTYRIAEQVRSGAARADEVLALTFTERAAAELRARLDALGLDGAVRATTFHSAALAQLRWFWPRVGVGPEPRVLPSKLPLLVASARRLGFDPRDVIAEIEWAKARTLGPSAYARSGRSRAQQFAQLYAGYETEKARQGMIDYEDMLLRMTEALRSDAQVAAELRARYRVFTVDEFQDVNPAQWALLQAWLGPSRELCVVGDENQAIFGFTGASPAYLTAFRRHFPEAAVVTLRRNYRSTGPIVHLAERVLARPGRQLVAEQVEGPSPRVHAFDEEADEREAVVDRIAILRDAGVPARQIAIAYRMHSQSEPFEELLRDRAVPYLVRGAPSFYARTEIQQALRALRVAADRPDPDPPPPQGATAAAVDFVRFAERVLRTRLGWHPRREPEGEAARERWRNLCALLDALGRLQRAHPDRDVRTVIEELLRHGRPEDTAPDAVSLLTLHKSKGLEFDAVFLVGLEEGLLPVSHARDAEAIDEERRLLYVGMTRARWHLWLSWARSRGGLPRRRSRFLAHLQPLAGHPSPGQPDSGQRLDKVRGLRAGPA